MASAQPAETLVALAMIAGVILFLIGLAFVAVVVAAAEIVILGKKLIVFLYRLQQE